MHGTIGTKSTCSHHVRQMLADAEGCDARVAGVYTQTELHKETKTSWACSCTSPMMFSKICPECTLKSYSSLPVLSVDHDIGRIHTTSERARYEWQHAEYHEAGAMTVLHVEIHCSNENKRLKSLR